VQLNHTFWHDFEVSLSVFTSLQNEGSRDKVVNLAICEQITCVKNTIPLRKSLIDKTTFCTTFKIVLPFAMCNCVVYFTIRQMGLKWLLFLSSPILLRYETQSLVRDS
jgi:hypothetical protein